MENEEKVMGKKRQFHELKTNSNELSCDNIEPVKAFTNTLKAWRGPPIRSPNKSVIANLQRKYATKFSQSSSSKSSTKSTHSSPPPRAIKLPLPLPLKYEMHCQGNRAFYRFSRLKSIETQTYAMYMHGKKSYWTWCSLGNKRENFSQISC